MKPWGGVPGRTGNFRYSMTTDFPTVAARGRTLRALLVDVLANESRLAAVSHAYVWRVRGSPRQSFKRLIGEQARQVERWVAELRDCARAVGITTGGGAPPVEPAAAASPRPDVVTDLLARHEAIVAELRGAVAAATERDPDGRAALVLGGLLEFHETAAWMLRLVLNSPERSRIA